MTGKRYGLFSMQAVRILCWLAVGSAIFAAGALATPVYNTPVEPGDWTGSRSIGNGLAGTGSWGQSFSISWVITVQTPGTLHYEYTFSWQHGAPSHAIFELSEGCASDGAGCVWEFLFDGVEATPTFGTFSGANPSNPNMPNPIYGVKIDRPDDVDGLVLEPDDVDGLVLEFDSNLLPVWGTFYSKDGVAGGMGVNAVWNLGLETANANSDNVLYFIARPDSEAMIPEIPEPGTMALLGAGLVALGLIRRRG
ncbi:MAG: PEP-CTERM sorting domain-containing protein [Bryobacteraceae bacterium]